MTGLKWILGLIALLAWFDPSSGLLRRKLFTSTEQANVRLNHLPLGGQDDLAPLFLTPYIESGKLAEGRNLSEVRGLPGPQIKSYAGYLTVNKTYNSNLFFWFFPPLSGKTDVPVLLWLQGGPGGSSLFGLFIENGPLKVVKDGSVHLRNYTWNREYAVLYIDNPVGTGFSFTENDKGYARNEDDVARDLYEGLKQFFALYQEFHGRPFYVTGESYAGKYVPAISHKIYKEGNAAKQAGINLKGLAIGDGLCDPRNMLNYGDYLYQIGLVDESQRNYFYEQQKKAESYIDNGEFYKAFQIFDLILNGDLTGKPSYFTNVTGMTFYFNFLYGTEPEEFAYYNKFLGQESTRRAIHVGRRPYSNGTIVEKHLLNDVMNSVKPWIEDLLNARYPILMYSGQLDIIVAAPLTENFLTKLKWSGAKKYITAPRYVYKVAPEDAVVAGYVRQVDNLVQVIIRNAGHILPYDQPRVAYDMISRFVNRAKF